MSTEDKTEKVSTKTTFTFGNFLVEVELENGVIETLDGAVDLIPYLLDGCTQKLQRKPAGIVEKALAGYTKQRSEMGKDWKRTDIPFSPKGVSLIEATFGEAVSDVAIVSASEYVVTTAGESMALAKAAIDEREGDEEELTGLAKRSGYDGDGELTVENEAFVKAVHGRLAKLRSERLAKAKVAE